MFRSSMLIFIYTRRIATCAAAYTLSKKGTFYDVTICYRNLTNDTGIYTANLKQPSWIDWFYFW